MTTTVGPAPAWFRSALTALLERRDLSGVQMWELMHGLLGGGCGHVGAVRRRLGVFTLFNCIGPLANPAGAAYQLLGVGRLDWLDRLAGALARLGTRHALLVCSRDGMDEVSLSAPTLVREVRGGA